MIFVSDWSLFNLWNPWSHLIFFFNMKEKQGVVCVFFLCVCIQFGCVTHSDVDLSENLYLYNLIALLLLFFSFVFFFFKMSRVFTLIIFFFLLSLRLKGKMKWGKVTGKVFFILNNPPPTEKGKIREFLVWNFNVSTPTSKLIVYVGTIVKLFISHL